MSEYGIDIALIQETYLKPSRPKACTIADYVQLRTDRTHGMKGGTALYFRHSTHCGSINIPPLINMVATGCGLAMTGHRVLVIVSVYLPSPKSGREKRVGGSGVLGSQKAPGRRSRIDKTAALRRASAYPTAEHRSRARALQRRMRTRVKEVRNEKWSDLMEKITPLHKAFWKVTKALKTKRFIPVPPIKKPDNSVAQDDAEIAKCLADSIDSQCSHSSPPHEIAHIKHIEEKFQNKTSLEAKDDLPPV
ncbi:hypothetical protein EVAR_9943_1 [Eumeta japonica]|uniref:RNA-directed DNA polymerase from mobile element jockey n=1 Tax=Eumeta variegata TaxID=151549 RepID=A0A4C1TQT5_EUMVA|nr:hypothetical protein EVAR_9943_1 [Eumeta japonica]